MTFGGDKVLPKNVKILQKQRVKLPLWIWKYMVGIEKD